MSEMNLADMNAREIPPQMKYSQITPLGLAGRSKKVKFFPNNAGSFTGTQNNIIRIPISSASCFLDPALTSLRLVYTNLSLADANFDSSCHSLISRMRITSKSGGVDLEDIRYYSFLHAMMADLQMGSGQRVAKYNEGYGTRGIYSPAQQAQVAGQPNTANQPAYGGCDYSSIGTDELKVLAGDYHTTFLSLTSSLIGTSAQKYLPLFLIGELMLEIELNQFPTYGNLECNYKIEGVELHTQLIEFGGDVNTALSSMALSTGIYLHGVNWMGIMSAVAIGNASLLVSERLKSIKSLFTIFCLPRTTTLMRLHARDHVGATSFQLKIGSELYPNQAIIGTSFEQDNSEFVVETLKAIGEYANLNHESLFNSESFANSGNLQHDVGRAVYGIDLDAFSGQRLESGVNTILNNPINVNFTGVHVACNSYTFLMHDVIYSIRPDGVFTVSR